MNQRSATICVRLQPMTLLRLDALRSLRREINDQAHDPASRAQPTRSTIIRSAIHTYLDHHLTSASPTP